MRTQRLADKYSVFAVLMLLVLTAWGNALAMFMASLMGLTFGMALLRRNVAINGVVVALLGSALAATVALFRLF